MHHHCQRSLLKSLLRLQTKDEKSGAKKEGDKKDTKKEEDKTGLDFSSQQAVAVLGIGLISMGEEIGSQMSLRMFGHLVSEV